MRLVETFRRNFVYARNQSTLFKGLILFLFITTGLGMAIHPVFAQSLFPTTESIQITVFTWISNLILSFTNMIGLMVIMLIETILVPILNYNSFSSSEIIGLGWGLIRNVVNMFVVAILLVIAIFTMIGSSRVNWQQAIPNLLLTAILVNFSRTICGFLIDVSQVIMFTFVNALLEVGAGNMTNLLQLQNFGKYSLEQISSDAARGVTVGITIFNQVGLAYLQLALYIAILGIMLLLALAFLYRIIILWVLVIMSPLAFFANGVKGIIGVAGNIYSQWMSKFTAALMMGPILTFFLWLSLAVAASGPMATTESFPMPDTPQSVGLLSFTTDSFLSVLLGLLLLVVGMQQASSSAGQLGGWAAKYITEDYGKAIVKGALTKPLISLDRRLAPKGAASFTAGAGISAIDVGRQLATSERLKMIPGGAGLGGALGRGFIEAGGAVQRLAEGPVAAQQKAAKERIGKLTTEQALAEMDLMEQGKGSAFLRNRYNAEALEARLVTDKRWRNKKTAEVTARETNIYRAEHKGEGLSEDQITAGGAAKAAQQMDKRIQLAMNSVDENRDSLLDDNEKAKLDRMKNEYLHLLGRPKDPNVAIDDEKQKAAIRKFVKSNDFDPTEVSDRAVNDKNVQEVFTKELDRRIKEPTSLYKRFAAGMYKARIAGQESALAAVEVSNKTAVAEAPVAKPVVVGGPVVKEEERVVVSEALNKQRAAIAAGRKMSVYELSIVAGETPESLGMIPPPNASSTAKQSAEEKISSMVRDNTASARYLSPHVQAPDSVTGQVPRTDVTAAIVKALSQKSFTEVLDHIRDASEEERGDIRVAMETIGRALQAEIASAKGPGSGVQPEEITRLESLAQAHRGTSRYL